MVYLTILDNKTIISPWELRTLYQTAQAYFKKTDWSFSAVYLYFIHQQAPDFHQALFQLAISQMSLSYWHGAEESLNKLREVLPWNPDVLCNLAIVNWKQKKLKQSLIFFKFNLKNFPQHSNSLINLANLYIEYQHFNQAIKIYNQLVYLHPQQIEYRYNLAACLQKTHHFQAALFHYQQIMRENSQHYETLYNIACIYWQLKNISAARFYWQAAQRIKNSPHIQFILQTLVNNQANFTHHQAYVTALFQQYAGHYEYDLKKQLHYQLPVFLSHYLKNLHYQNALEIGCGTGLTGLVIQKFCDKLIGIDLSKNMLEKAREKNCYNRLYEAEAITFLEQNIEKFECLFALDVSPYMIDFYRIFAFSQNTEIIFTIEISDCFPHQFQSNGRISYHPDWIIHEAQQHGFQVYYQKKLAARMQNQLFIDLLFLHLKKEFADSNQF